MVPLVGHQYWQVEFEARALAIIRHVQTRFLDQRLAPDLGHSLVFTRACVLPIFRFRWLKRHHLACTIASYKKKLLS